MDKTSWPYEDIVSLPHHVSRRHPPISEETRAAQFLSANTQRCVVKSKSAQQGSVELNLEVRLKDDNTDFINTLAGLDGVHSAVLVSYNGDYMG